MSFITRATSWKYLLSTPRRVETHNCRLVSGSHSRRLVVGLPFGTGVGGPGVPTSPGRWGESPRSGRDVLTRSESVRYRVFPSPRPRTDSGYRTTGTTPVTSRSEFSLGDLGSREGGCPPHWNSSSETKRLGEKGQTFRSTLDGRASRGHLCTLTVLDSKDRRPISGLYLRA